jgi:hypothetical protein
MHQTATLRPRPRRRSRRRRPPRRRPPPSTLASSSPVTGRRPPPASPVPLPPPTGTPLPPPPPLRTGPPPAPPPSGVLPAPRPPRSPSGRMLRNLLASPVMPCSKSEPMPWVPGERGASSWSHNCTKGAFSRLARYASLLSLGDLGPNLVALMRERYSLF